MKKSILILTFLLGLAFSGKAQMQKGSWMLDGQVGLSMNRQENQTLDATFGTFSNSYRLKEFSLSPGLGYFFQNNLAIGLAPSFGIGWGKEESSGNTSINFNSFEYGLGVFSRKYFPVGDRLSFFGDFRIGGFCGDLGSKEESSSDRTVLTKSSGLEAGLSLGLQYLIKDYLGIHVQSSMIDYRKSTENRVAFGGSSTITSWNTQLFSAFQIGATVFF
ncbi:MAG: hypothetical protein EP311_05275 [Cytophagales bacterium]|nr:MAG: hypothetical protein EP311_05275 [Cytophagales bacterium]